MHPLRILIASMHSDLVTDLVAEALFAEVRKRTDIALVSERVLDTAEVPGALRALDESMPYALILVGSEASRKDSPAWLHEQPALLVAHVVLDAGAVHVDARDVGIGTLLSTISMLAVQRHDAAGAGKPCLPSSACAAPAAARSRTLLSTALAWVHALMSDAVGARQRAADELPGLVASQTAVQSMLDAEGSGVQSETLKGAEAGLLAALVEANPVHAPLAALHRKLGLDLLELKLVLLALAPELDLRYQKCVGFLLDDMGQRAGTLALFTALLGDAPTVRRKLAQAGRLAQWRLFNGEPGASDLPLRVDPCIVHWLLGRADALEHDPYLRHALRPLPWLGAQLLRRPADQAEALHLLGELHNCTRPHWVVLTGSELAGWRALLELGAQAKQLSLQRCEVARLAGADRQHIEETAARLARREKLTGHVVVLDADAQPADAQVLQVLLASLVALGQAGAIVTPDPAPVLAILASDQVTVRNRQQADATARGSALLAAAAGLGLTLDIAEACALGATFPLPVDRLALAARLAHAGARAGDSAGQLRQALSDSLRDTASQDITPLVSRITPRFDLDDVILPRERHSQLGEIVANVRLAPKVLDEWRFAEKLAYGRGVTVLFHGPSGTGKTMAAQAIAKRLGIDLFALDLSRVVSKYIGETEKNIDAVFCAAQRSGAAVLVDEADALFGKRSEVRDAHDRYANIEVAYLLQRMEQFEGLAVLTTNLRQNLDPAFLRRLRFMIEFPRPDADAREGIWRQCLPDGSHRIGDDEFRLLARKVELTGGHIRQITLRAAFAAAAAESPITIRHIGHAMSAELAKLGLPAVRLEPVEKAA
jgi:SpoVK/Ycf46/Vps4 family AAA+-type ATPase